jgi:ABC-type anion transport system duplicated permease subunit
MLLDILTPKGYSNTMRIILAIVFPVFITGLSCTYGGKYIRF